MLAISRAFYLLESRNQLQTNHILLMLVILFIILAKCTLLTDTTDALDDFDALCALCTCDAREIANPASTDAVDVRGVKRGQSIKEARPEAEDSLSSSSNLFGAS
ncbi:unnamed protein product [Protopolystoma xenopodis]|uniref:Uncharacterized protein n=1 Tax=Protopolystoma xenopodis TaxID=117903 RepID=A0A448WKJ2_9PLAT|nr:unnamed protein product [Protopolystoma xenopodis]